MALTRIALRTSEPDHPIEAEAVRIGEDLLVAIFGGERPHIGAVAAAQARPSLADPARTSATASVLTYVGHKEDDIAKRAAEALAAAFGVHAVVTVGIHWDGLTPAEIALIATRCDALVRMLIERLAR